MLQSRRTVILCNADPLLGPGLAALALKSVFLYSVGVVVSSRHTLVRIQHVR